MPYSTFELRKRLWKDSSLSNAGPKFAGFPENELETIPSIELQAVKNATSGPATVEIKLIVLEGGCEITKTHLREFANPDAARQTFQQNATDIFMDCPSRERSGRGCWTCWIISNPSRTPMVCWKNSTAGSLWNGPRPTTSSRM
ncbi:MAG: hypothetical protein EHM17_07910 [Verrucomicrobiaceae bacterium]|nr:MAG: hypothetical protein EHM17_07910 [Verrucomicrobiaceae bacterium]